jgi:hypothetical protein
MIQPYHFWAYAPKNQRQLIVETPVYCGTINKCQIMESASVPINRWMDKMWYLYTMKLH